MSTLYKIHTIKLNPKRVPSHAFILRMLGVSIAAGHKAIDIKWRGDFMQLDCDKAGKWRGVGMIDQESGHSIAGELNGIATFIKNHFSIINIGEAGHA